MYHVTEIVRFTQEPLCELLGDQLGIPIEHVHINAGSELILRQLFDRNGQQVHLVTPAYPCSQKSPTSTPKLDSSPRMTFDPRELEVPDETTPVVIVNPDNPNGSACDMRQLPDLLNDNPEPRSLVDEAFVDKVDESVVNLGPEFDNLLVTCTLSKAHRLAGFRVGYAILSEPIADNLNTSNNAYPLARPSQAAAIATHKHETKIQNRIERLRTWTDEAVFR